MADLDPHLRAIAAGDPDAFGRWVAGAERRLRESLRRFAASLDVEAVLQETLLRVWQVAPRFAPDGRPDALLRLGVRIARNLAVSEIRRSSGRPVDEDEIDFERPADPRPGGTDPHLRRHLEECREKLPRQPARALAERLQAAGGAPDEILAERLGMRLNTFLQNFTRARKLLAECLKRRGVDLEAELR
jgi:RNA polymerase sigma-70 factor (ECF subfamily)